MDERPPRFPGLPSSLTSIFLWIVVLGLFYNLVVWLWERYAG